MHQTVATGCSPQRHGFQLIEERSNKAVKRAANYTLS